MKHFAAHVALWLSLGFSLCSAQGQAPERPPASDEAAGELDDEKSDELQAGEVLEGHSGHGEAFDEGPRQAADLMQAEGAVSFPISTQDPRVQAMFHQGVRQLHGFWYFEAERSFRQAAALEPDGPLPYWGMAMANRENPQRAAAFAHEAWLRRAAGSARERLYAESIARLYGADRAEFDGTAEVAEPNGDHKQGLLADLEAIVEAYPEDLEAKAFLVNQYWHDKSSHSVSQERREELLQEIFSVHPLHPAHHYRIHLWDQKSNAERVLDSVASVGPSSPSVAHHWHMGGHALDKLGRYADAAWQQEAASRVDHAHMMRDLILPDRIHNFAHNNEWLIRSLRHAGRGRAALELAKNMIELPRHPSWNAAELRESSAAYGPERLLETLEEFELWDELRDLSGTPYLRLGEDQDSELQRSYLLGRAQAFLGDDAGLEEVLHELELLGESARRSADRRGARERQDQLVAIQDLLAGRELEDSAEVLEEAELAPSILSWLLADVGAHEDALRLAEELVEEQPKSVVPLASLAYAHFKAGQAAEAKRALEQLRAISTGIDLDVAPLMRLAPLAASLGWPRDWRLAASAPADLGPRVDLERLGPARWSPPQAPEWQAKQPDGELFGSLDSGGEPRVLILFLGLGCVHCIEQLQAFAPYADAFDQAGLKLYTVGDDTAEDLDDADVEEAYPFPVLADPGHEVFKTYRCFDDFEEMPLHGTFLLDAQDRIRWMDVGPEPFTDAQFLLDEAARLFALDAN